MQPTSIQWGKVALAGNDPKKTLKAQLTLPDPGAAAPALFAWLCGDGDAEVSYGFETETR